MSDTGDPPPRTVSLPRVLGPNAVLMLTLAALSPAASLFVTGAAILHLAGTGAALAVLGGAAAVLISTFLYAELGEAFPHAGGVYHGIAAMLGPRAGAATLMLGLVTAPALLAFSSLGLASYIRALGITIPLNAIAIAAIALTTLLAMLRVRFGLWLAGALLVAELAVLVTLTVVCWASPVRSLGEVLLHPVVASGNALRLAAPVTLIIATIAAAFACSGANLAINFAEDLAGDQRLIGTVVRRAGIVSVFLIAVPLIGLTVAIPDLATALSSEAPIATGLHSLFGSRSADLLTAIIAVAILDHLGGAMLAYSRLVFAAARTLSGVAAPLARADAWTQAPARAAIALGCIAAMLTMIGEQTLLVLIVGELITPALMIVAVIKIRRRRSRRGPLLAAVAPLPIIGLCILAVFTVATLMNYQGVLSLLLLAGVAVIAALVFAKHLRRSTGIQIAAEP